MDFLFFGFAARKPRKKRLFFSCPAARKNKISKSGKTAICFFLLKPTNHLWIVFSYTVLNQKSPKCNPKRNPKCYTKSNPKCTPKHDPKMFTKPCRARAMVRAVFLKNFFFGFSFFLCRARQPGGVCLGTLSSHPWELAVFVPGRGRHCGGPT